MLFKMLAIERTARKLGEKSPRQVFVTQSRVLADKVETYFRDLMRSCSGDLLSEDEREKWLIEGKQDHDELPETDDEDDASTELPNRFSELEDKHFPLFLTFDKVIPPAVSIFMSTDTGVYSFVGCLRVMSNPPTIKQDIKRGIKSHISCCILRNRQAAQLSVSCMKTFVQRIGLDFHKRRNCSVCSSPAVSPHRLRLCRSCSGME
jgi:hypothetical protein